VRPSTGSAGYYQGLYTQFCYTALQYGQEGWSESDIKEMGKCQRRIALRVASAYCSVSADAVLIIANIPPIYLVKERLDTFNQKQLGTQRDVGRTELMGEWQARWRLLPKAGGHTSLSRTLIDDQCVSSNYVLMSLHHSHHWSTGRVVFTIYQRNATLRQLFHRHLFLNHPFTSHYTQIYTSSIR